MTARRIVSIYLPQFAMERWHRAMERTNMAPPDDIPIALVTEGTHGPIIHAANRAARIAGVTKGNRVVDIRAICPDLRIEYADIAGDKLALNRLVLWVRRWCPWTVADGWDGLILDTTGSAHLLGGECEMLIDMETQLALLGLTARLAVAPTWGAAWALARFGGMRPICMPDDFLETLSPLPVQALRLCSNTLLLLRRLGLKTIGTLARVPRLSLTRRFSRSELTENPLLRLDQAMGRLAEPVSSVEARAVFRAQARLPEPIQDPTHYLPELCQTLCVQLAHAGCGCRKLDLTVFRSDGEISTINVATSTPNRDPEHLQRLFDDKIERINPGFGFDLITLEAGAAEPLDDVQSRLNGQADDAIHLSRLIDRLTTRLGPKAITKPVLQESHMPEHAQSTVIAMNNAQNLAKQTLKPRPIRLLYPAEELRVIYAVPEGPPAQFIWRKQNHHVMRHEGPERIAPEWWRDRPSTRLRDYFRIEDQTGRRFWLYREGLHEDGRGGDPRWFLHGMFA